MRRLRAERAPESRRSAPVGPRADAPVVRRIAGKDDGGLAEVEAIARACFSGSGFSVEEELSRPWSRVWAARCATESPTVGFLVAWHIADELHVLNVATTPELRRRGIGRALMDEALGYASTNHIRIVLLEVRRSNRAAIKLYRCFGFTAMGVRPGYYSDNDEDAVEMILALDPQTGEVLPSRDEIRIDG